MAAAAAVTPAKVSADLLHIRAATAADLEVLAGLEAQLFDSPLSLTQLQLTLERQQPVLVAVLGGRLCGYAIANQGGGIADLVSIGVAPSHHRKGIAEALLLSLQRWLVEMEVEALFLEVRAGNAAAIACYQKLGLEQVGRRKDYYPLVGDTGGAAGREDALVFKLALTSPTEA